MFLEYTYGGGHARLAGRPNPIDQHGELHVQRLTERYRLRQSERPTAQFDATYGRSLNAETLANQNVSELLLRQSQMFAKLLESSPKDSLSDWPGPIRLFGNYAVHY
jgi:hypothetical protein